MLVTIETANCSEMSNVINNNFFNDSKLNITLENKFQYLKSNDYPVEDSIVQTAWAQGVRLDFISGLIDENYGLDISYASVAKLAASDYFYTRQYLYSSGDDNTAEGFSKFEQAYFKQEFYNNDNFVKLKEGQIYLDNFGIIDGLNKVTNTSYFGVLSDVLLNNFEYRIGYFDKYMNADTPHNSGFSTFGGERYNYIITGDVTYKSGNSTVKYLVGEQDNYLFRQGLEYIAKSGQNNYSLEIYHNRGLSAWDDMSDDMKSFDSNAYHINMEMSHFSDKWVSTIGYSYTSAKKKNGLGRFIQSLDNMTFNSQAYGLSEEFINDNESVVTLINIYKMTSSYDIGFISRFGYGHTYKGNNLFDVELALFNQWKPDNIDNLSFVLGFGPNWTFKRNYYNQPVLDSDGNWKRGGGLCVTSSIKYVF